MDRNLDGKIDKKELQVIQIIYLCKVERLLYSSPCIVTHHLHLSLYVCLHQAWILRSFRMLSQEESTERFEDNNEDDDDFVTWDEYKANEFEDLEDLEDGAVPDASKLEDISMMEEDKVLFFVSIIIQ